MKRGVRAVLVTLVMATVALTGCTSSPSGDGVAVSLAPIHELDVRVAESFPPQVFVYIKGGLADGCTTFRGLEVERSGNTIEIEVTVQRPRDAVCTQIYSYFEQNINLGTDFISGQTYTVKVNDKATTFVMP